jgi:hypothetical protein
VTDTKKAIVNVWRQYELVTFGISREAWDALDAAIRADERATNREIARQLKERHRDIAPAVTREQIEALPRVWSENLPNGDYVRLDAVLALYLHPPAVAPPSESADAGVTRFEVIDHRSRVVAIRRAFVAYDCAVELEYQDAGRTLKVFVVDAAQQEKP